ncbi:alpha/beta fold hydrolase [Streptomyces sp. IB2014 016-6]|uniref:thioesterase II family protein n=1 Tax=Streptomyces sp. IB2014 016-6 TaxID=2517818 RepID=UPI0011CCCD2B|nr:alpha/beta fold hydrolase [Streptomyces sp. IB2014 016-6]TXL88165.1 thioesterase [Streptomyces sp. IB2014 016-6]
MRPTAPLGPVTRRRPVDDPTVRLFFFHHAGGSHLLYRGWTRLFPDDWDICLLDAPGRGNAQAIPLIDDCADLVAFFDEALAPLLNRPFAFFGHSVGARVAYALTRRLQGRARELPLWLGVSSFRAPQPDSTGPSLSRSLRSDTALRDWLTDTGGAPDRLLSDDSLWNAFAPVLRCDLGLADTWDRETPRTPLPVPLTVFGGTDDTVVPLRQLDNWPRLTADYRGLHTYSGGHFYLNDHREGLAGLITRTVLDQLGPPPRV